VARKTAEDVTDSIVTLLDGFKDFVHTLTFDKGKEFARHQTLAKKLKCQTCFAKPCHFWERGQNENANGLLRQCFPKATGLLEVTQQQVLKRFTDSTQDPGKAWDLKLPMRSFACSPALMLKKSALMHLSLEFTFSEIKIES